MLLSVGCKTIATSQTSSLKIKDSVSVREVTTVKDSLVYTDVDSAAIKALVICPGGKPLDIKPTIAKGNKQATAIFEIKNGVASVQCFCDSVGIINRTTNTVLKEFKQHLNDSEKSETKVIEVTVYPRWLKILAAIGVASILFHSYKLIRKFY